METMTQEELELEMLETGYAHTQQAIRDAEEKGAADRTPYAQSIYQEYTQPLAVLISEALDAKVAGRKAAHVSLLRGLDPWVIAYCTVRAVLNYVMAARGAPKIRAVASDLGRVIYGEVYLAQFNELAPDLYFIIVNDLDRRKGTDAQHRVRTFQKQAKAAGMTFDEWGPGAKDQVGAWLLELLRGLGMITMDEPQNFKGKREPVCMYLHPDIVDMIQDTTHEIAMLRPRYGPCIEPPRPWEGWTGGGWHTPGLQRLLPFPVKASSAARDLLQGYPMPLVWKALTALQNVPWEVNDRVFHIVDKVSRERNVKEFALVDPPDKPEYPLDLQDKPREDYTQEDLDRVEDWKANVTAWYTEAKLLAVARIRFAGAMRMARQYLQHARLFFVYFCDSRGRVYPMSQGLNPQGSDVQKGLLRFHRGDLVKIGTPAADWFHYNGANLWGFDKAHPTERVSWHEERKPMLMAMAQDPENNQEWLDADNPVQFLAWLLEYHELHSTGTVNTKLPVHLDGSCSGLQHFSAMLRDHIGGRATNLVPCQDMQDIYRTVAEVATESMLEAAPDEEGYRDAWLAHGITRKVTKRSVMTSSYGVTKRSAIRYVIDDYLRVQDTPWAPRQHYQAASYLMDYAWPAIGKVVIKAKQAMEYLDKAGAEIVKFGQADTGVISWPTPSGFLATQSYYVHEVHNINSKLYGHARIKVLTESDEPSANEHSTGLSPNFIHSMDASHLHLVVHRMHREHPSAPLAMVHDSFGTTAPRTAALYAVLRDEFVKMYTEHDPLQDFSNMYKLPGIPAKGDLDLNQVRESMYVFS